MIKLTYDYKLGVEDLYVVVKDDSLGIPYDDSDIEEETELFNELKNYTDEEKIDFVYNFDTQITTDLLINFFSAEVLDNEDFIENAEIFDVSNVRITRE